jgi:hypothetical protein
MYLKYRICLFNSFSFVQTTTKSVISNWNWNVSRYSYPKPSPFSYITNNTIRYHPSRVSWKLQDLCMMVKDLMTRQLAYFKSSHSWYHSSSSYFVCFVIINIHAICFGSIVFLRFIAVYYYRKGGLALFISPFCFKLTLTMVIISTASPSPNYWTTNHATNTIQWTSTLNDAPINYFRWFSCL